MKNSYLFLAFVLSSFLVFGQKPKMDDGVYALFITNKGKIYCATRIRENTHDGR